MITPLNVITPSSIALELHGRVGEQAWYLISSADPVATVKDVCAALASADIAFRQVSARRPEDLIRERHLNAGACVPTDMWDWDDTAYGRLDYLRAPIRQLWPVVVWVTRPHDIERMVHHAPNFSAFFQPSAGTWSNGTMAPSETEAHLVALRRQYGLSDLEVVDKAMKGELPEDADHQTWLVLLGRGDLIRKPRIP